jgi:ATP-binding cassette subfamily B protein
MKIILKYLGHYWKALILVFLFLVAQAWCDLKLPEYTANIVNIGIGQKGIEYSVPEAISSDNFEMLMGFSENNDIEKYYTINKNGYYELNSDINLAHKKDYDKVYNAVKTPILQLLQNAPATAEMLAGIDLENAPDVVVDKVLLAYTEQELIANKYNLDEMQSDYIWIVGFKMLLMSLFMMAASIGVGFLASRISSKCAFDLRRNIFSKVMSFSNAEIDKYPIATLITRSTNDIVQMQMFTFILLRMVLYAPIIGTGGVIKVVHGTQSIAWIIGVSVAAIIVLVMCLLVFAMPKFKAFQTQIDKLNLVAREILTGLPVIRAFAREKYEEDRFDVENKSLTKLGLFVNKAMSIMFPLMFLIMDFTMVMIVWFGAKSIDAGQLEVGDMIAFIAYAMQIIFSFLMLTMVSVMMPRAAVAGNRVAEILNTEESIPDIGTKEATNVSSYDVVFDNVDFDYPDAPDNALEGINFTAKSGEMTAIIGSTGSGKSTLINLIPRFYDVTSGKITIGGVDIRDFKQSELRSLIGLVPQKAVLFSGTIEENLHYGDENATIEELKAAAEIAQSADFIDEKDDGYESHIAQGGANVSGGQKQRLAIARAIVKKPKIYIFDDSFSALDYKTAANLRKALKDNMGDSTLIVVAQRINTVLSADKIIVVDEGKIVGMGTHEELLESCGEYCQIAISQLSEEELGLA